MKYMLLSIAFYLILLSCNTRNQNESQTLTPSYTIAYNVYAPDSTSEDNYEVFTMNMDGSEPRNITQNPDVAWTYLAVGDKVLFISDRDTCYRCFYLFECDAEGNNLRQITDFKLKDSWMGSRKNGEELIVTPREDSVFYIINRKGEILQRINAGLAYYNDPAFSPDGAQIVFRGSTVPFKQDNGYIDELYIMNSDGSGLKQLTHYPESDTTAQWHNYHAGPPRWHPIENFISYQSKQNGKYSLFGIKTDGSAAWKLTDLEWSEGWHSWSPDGNWLAIELFDNDQEQFHIGLMNWTSKEFNILTDTTYQYQQAPVFVE